MGLRQIAGEDARVPQNSWGGRKGSLSLWKLRRPNLTLGFLRSGKTVEKLVTCSLLAGMALRPAVLAEGRPGLGHREQGNTAGGWA